jgi:aquaporin Z
MKMEVSFSIAGSVPARRNKSSQTRSLFAVTNQNKSSKMIDAIENHWPEYLIEGMGLCFFMVSACVFATVLFHPTSRLSHLVAGTIWQRLLMGAAMGLTAIAIIYSPWGKRSGAHTNPATTLTFFRLGKIEPWDAFFYVLAQFAGGSIGVFISRLMLGMLVADPSVNYVATVPGSSGQAVAFLAEVTISFILMSVVLTVSNTPRIDRWTGLFAGVLVMIYITLESPISGMSMNPARTFGSAISGGVWTGLWIYFTAPPLGMLLAAEAYMHFRGSRAEVACAKLHHRNNQRCIFRCEYKGHTPGDKGQGSVNV